MFYHHLDHQYFQTTLCENYLYFKKITLQYILKLFHAVLRTEMLNIIICTPSQYLHSLRGQIFLFLLIKSNNNF